MNRKERRRREHEGRTVPPRPEASAAAQPIQAPPVVEEKPNAVAIRTASVAAMMPYSIYNGRLQNPDPVQRQFGGQLGPAFYRLMMEENLGLSACCSQAEDRIGAIDRVIKPGDDSPMADEMANDVRRIFKSLIGTSIINTWIYRCRWFGFSSIGLAGWKKKSGSNILAPYDPYNIDPWKWKFGPNFEPYLLTQRDPYQGERVPPRSVFFTRWGSLFTAYGESDLRDVYLSCWYMQNVQEMLLHSIEVLGRPIPWIEAGDGMAQPDRDAFEAGIKKDYKYYVITWTPNAKPSTTFPNMGALANGTAGKSEQDFMRYHDGLIQRKILGTQQTQDKTGGSRALEDSRLAIAHDKTPPGSQVVDQAWTSGWLDAIGMVNWPNQPREVWPVMDSDAADVDDEPMDGAQADAVAGLAEQLRLNQVSEAWVIENLVRLKFKRSRATHMVSTMVKADLSKDPAVPKPAKVAA